jgi:hypothetical protein
VHGVRKEAVGGFGRVGRQARRLTAAFARGQGRAPGFEAREAAEIAGALQARERDESGGVADQRRIRREQERLEGDGVDAREGAVADPEADGAAGVGEGGGDEPGRGIGAEQQRRRSVQPAASSTAAR